MKTQSKNDIRRALATRKRILKSQHELCVAYDKHLQKEIAKSRRNSP